MCSNSGNSAKVRFPRNTTKARAYRPDRCFGKIPKNGDRTTLLQRLCYNLSYFVVVRGTITPKYYFGSPYRRYCI